MTFLLAVLFFANNYLQALEKANLCSLENVAANIKLIENSEDGEKFFAIYELNTINKICPPKVIANSIPKEKLSRKLVDVMSSVESVLDAQVKYGEIDSSLMAMYLELSMDFNVPETLFRNRIKNSEEFNINNKAISKDSCSTVDLLEKSKPLAVIEMQSDSNLCYAFSVSDLLSYRLNKKISPLYIAANGYGFFSSILNIGTDLAKKSGSETIVGLENSISDGVCIESGTSLTDFFYKTRGELALSEISDQLNSLEPMYTSINSKQLLALHKVKLLFPNLSNQEIWQIIAETKSSFFNYDIFSRLLKASCNKNLISDVSHLKPHQIKYDFMYPRTKVEDIDEQLNKLNPVSVTIAMNALQASPVNHFEYSNRYSQSLARHAITIVGRKYNTTKNVCEYFVKHQYPSKSHWEKLSNQNLPPGLTVITRSDLDLIVQELDYLE